MFAEAVSDIADAILDCSDTILELGLLLLDNVDLFDEGPLNFQNKQGWVKIDPSSYGYLKTNSEMAWNSLFQFLNTLLFTTQSQL